MTLRRLVLVAAMAMSACAPAANPTPVATTTVDLPRSYRFEPAAIVVALGASVTWTNSDNFTHSIQFDGDPAPGTVVAPGASTVRRFDEPGTFDYLCAFHPQDMHGTVFVTTAPGSETP